MTPEILLTLGILAISMVLFVTEKIRMDVVALMVLVTLALTGMVTPVEAISGFSNPAVITVWAMFILSGGLTQTGVAAAIGRQVLRCAGKSEWSIIIVIMLTTGSMSAFMNNIGVAALMLPVVLDIARRTGHAPSRLLMPLAYASLLGGLTTLIGTPPNLLASDAMRHAGLEPFTLFDFTPLGGCVMLGGILFIALVGRRLLPKKDPMTASVTGPPLLEQYALAEKTVVLRVPADSQLVGKTLGRARIGSAARLDVFCILRDGETRFAPGAEDTLRAGDRLLVQGELDRFEELRGWRELEILREPPDVSRLVTDGTGTAEVRITENASLVGRTLRGVSFKEEHGATVLAVRRAGAFHRANLQNLRLRPEDRLLLIGAASVLDKLSQHDDFDEFKCVLPEHLASAYHLDERLFEIRIPAGSILDGATLRNSAIGFAFGLRVIDILRDEQHINLPDGDQMLQAGDRLLIEGNPEDLNAIRGLQQLEVDPTTAEALGVFKSKQISLTEITLSPRSKLADKTLRQLDFREKYQLQALALWRAGKAHYSNLRDIPLQFGDALLLAGDSEKLHILGGDADFLILNHESQPELNTSRAPLASAIMGAVVVSVLLGWLPIAIAAVAGATLMVLARCLTMDQAYAAIEWRSIFLIAGMLPLGTAMESSGTALFLADQTAALATPMGPWGLIVVLYLMTALATMIIPTAALIVLMAPVAISTANTMGISPAAVMMAIAIAASASFTSPISHPANVLVMGPGGYRFADYLKLGIPLTLVVMAMVLILLPLFWPL